MHYSCVHLGFLLAKQYSYDVVIDFDDWFDFPYVAYRNLYNAVNPPIRLTDQQFHDCVNKDYKHF